MENTKIKKNAKGYGYTYTDLAEIHNYLEENGMKYIQQIDTLDGVDYILTRRYIDGKWENEWIRGCKVVNATLSGKSNPAQEHGSALTYARRYSLLMAFGLATTDDDAECLTYSNSNNANNNSNSTTPYKKKDKKESIEKETKKENNPGRLTARDKILLLGEERGISAKELAGMYGLTRDTTEERYEEVLRIMEEAR